MKPKGATNPQVNVLEGKNNLRFVSNPIVNVTTSFFDWWINTEANTHIYFDPSQFATFQNKYGGSVTLKNHTTVPIMRIEKIILKTSFEKTITLKDVLYAPDIRKNLVSGSLLCYDSYHLMFDSTQLVISYEKLFVGKRYSCDVLYKLNVISYNINGSSSFVVLNVEFSIYGMIDQDMYIIVLYNI